MTHPNATLSRRNYQAAAEGDFETIVDRMADDIVWHVGGHRRGVAGARRG